MVCISGPSRLPVFLTRRVIQAWPHCGGISRGSQRGKWSCRHVGTSLLTPLCHWGTPTHSSLPHLIGVVLQCLLQNKTHTLMSISNFARSIVSKFARNLQFSQNPLMTHYVSRGCSGTRMYLIGCTIGGWRAHDLNRAVLVPLFGTGLAMNSPNRAGIEFALAIWVIMLSLT